MKRIWLIRHGESIANAGEATDDHKSIPLSELGLKQAQALALQIPKRPDLIVTSPYLRAQQTAMYTIGRFPDTATGIGMSSMNLSTWRRPLVSGRHRPSGGPESSTIGVISIPITSMAKGPKAIGSSSSALSGPWPS